MQQVIAELKRLQRRSRAMLVLQRTSVLLACVLAALLALIGLDYALRLPSAFRMVLLLAGLGALGYGIWAYLRLAVLFRPSLTQVALRVEQVMPSVAGRLASSVEFVTAGVDEINPLAARTVRDTRARLAGESMTSIMRPGRTWRDVGIMAALAAVASLFALTNPGAASTGLQRVLLPYGSAKWPARTGVMSLMDDGSSGDGVGVHPRGKALPLRAKITRGANEQRVEAYYRLKIDGIVQPWHRILLTHQGNGVHERLVDTTAAEMIEFYFATEDDQSATQRIMIVPPPAVRRASLTVTPPAYAAAFIPTYQAELGQGVDARAVTEHASLVGSDVTLRLELNKPLPSPASTTPASAESTETWVRETFGWDDTSVPTFEADPQRDDVWQLHWRLEQTRSLNLRLIDEHGLANDETIAYRIEAVSDLVPAVTITQPQADEIVLPTAVVPLEIEARDDVAVATLGIEAHVQASNVNMDEALQNAPAWQDATEHNAPFASHRAELDLSMLHVAAGDVVLVSGVANDAYELDGQRHPVTRSPVRRLRVISELDFATQLRRQLGAVRQNAIRIEAMQGELQEDVMDDGVQPGMTRAQAQIGERIANQREAVREIERLLRQNQLDDPQLAEILRQTADIMDAAGRAANRATESLELASRTAQRTGAAQHPSTPSDRHASGEPQDAAQEQPGQLSRDERPNQNERDSQQSDTAPPHARAADHGTDTNASESGNALDIDADAFKTQQVPEDRREIVEAQQEVRNELTDLIKLLDRDEDTWVIRRQLENILNEQRELEEATQRLGQETRGLQPSALSQQQRSEADRIAQRQLELARRAREMTQAMRDRADALEQVDPQSARGIRNAADTSEREQLDREMEQAGQNVQQNQMASAGARQQSAQSTLQQMLNNIEETKRAQAQQLIRQLASLIESIQRLIVVQENELTALAIAVDAGNFGGLDRAMIRLNQNTQAVAGEARAAGQETRRIARALDRAADAQGAAVIALRAEPVDAPAAEAAENRSLDLLREAKALAEQLQQETQQQEAQRQREALIESYRQFAEMQIAVRSDTLELAKHERLDRRQLVEARRLGSRQDEIRTGLNGLRDVTREILDSPVFSHVHRMIDTWSASASDSLIAGTVDVNVTDHQQQIADSIGRLIEALQESIIPPDEFARDQQGDSGGQTGEQQQQLIPPVAQLKLLQGLQKQIYDLTRNLDSRDDLDDAQRRARLRDLGQQQRDLMNLGRHLLEELTNSQPTPNEPHNNGEGSGETE